MSQYWKKEHSDSGEWATISIKESPLNCCGLIEISNVGCGLNGNENLRYLLEKYVISNLIYIVTLVYPRYVNIFKEFGFTEIYTFVNPNTSNEVFILIYKK